GLPGPAQPQGNRADRRRALELVRFLFFFFQAEDGIRDGHVTGVQTCALPISGARRAVDRDRCGHRAPRPAPTERRTLACRTLLRSEERRVGKECRSRCSPYHQKKKTIDSCAKGKSRFVNRVESRFVCRQ